MSKRAVTGATADVARVRREIGRPDVGPSTLARVRLIAEALFSTAEGPPPLDRLDWLVDEVEDFLARAGAQGRWMFAVLTYVVTTLAPLFLGRLRTLPHLGRADRVAAIAAMERRFDEPLVAIKAILCLIYYEHPDTAREVGFDARCLTRATESREP